MSHDDRNGQPAASATPNRGERRKSGRRRRLATPHAALSVWSASSDRPDVAETFVASNRGRIETLLPLRVERMSESCFAWLRGSAGVMAQDLAAGPRSGIDVQLCGDCHLNNFGHFISPEQRVLFDINDFDESHPGPFEWDVKRLATSIVLAARVRRFSAKQGAKLARIAIAAYRRWIGRFAKRSPFALAHYQLHAGRVLRAKESKRWRRRVKLVMRESKEKIVDRRLDKVVETHEGRVQLWERASRLFHLPANDPFQLDQAPIWADYRRSLQSDRLATLARYDSVDFAFKAAGVGSVGLRDGLWLLADSDGNLLTLQVKEARPSVLAEADGVDVRSVHQGRRVVEAQRLLQSASDRFLGWAETGGRQYYLRHWRDMKGSIDVNALSAADLALWVELCGWALARAHAKAGDAATISGYLGKGPSFDRAILTFARAYADQAEADYERFLAAASTGQFAAAAVVAD